MISPLDSHYTGVFVAGPDHTIVSPTAEFTRRLLRRRILAAGAAGTGKAAGAWSPIVALHDAYSTGIEWHRYRGAWLGFQLPRAPLLPLTRYRSSPSPSPDQAPQQAILTRTLIRSRGAWRVTDETLPIWAESDWCELQRTLAPPPYPYPYPYPCPYPYPYPYPSPLPLTATSNSTLGPPASRPRSGRPRPRSRRARCCSAWVTLTLALALALTLTLTLPLTLTLTRGSSR